MFETIAISTAVTIALLTAEHFFTSYKLVKFLAAKNEALVKSHKLALNSAYTALKAEQRAWHEAEMASLKAEVKSEVTARVSELQLSLRDLAIVAKHDKKANLEALEAHQRVERLAQP